MVRQSRSQALVAALQLAVSQEQESQDEEQNERVFDEACRAHARALDETQASGGNSTNRFDFPFPIHLTRAQVSEMEDASREVGKGQTLYAVLSQPDGYHEVLVGNAAPGEEDSGDGVWLNTKGNELHGPTGHAQ